MRNGVGSGCRDHQRREAARERVDRPDHRNDPGERHDEGFAREEAVRQGTRDGQHDGTCDECEKIQLSLASFGENLAIEISALSLVPQDGH